MNSGSKLAIYRTLRSQGLRLYASRSNALIGSSCGCTSKRNLNTKNDDSDVGFIDRYKERFGLKGALAYYPATLRYSSFRLYLSAAEASRYNKVYEYVELPDTMTSWHKLTSLHVWLIMTRLVTEGREGKRVRNGCIETFITDMKEKSKVISKEMNIVIKGQELEKLHEQFLASVMAYDEGLLGSDKELAGALWRVMFDRKEDISPCDLEVMVAYVRKQVMHLQRIPSKQILTNGLIPFLPVHGDTVLDSAYEWLERINSNKLQFSQ